MAAVTARTAIASQFVSPGQTPSFCTATSSILALISFDDAPYDGVTHDVGCAEANSGNTVYAFQLRHGVCQPRCAGHGKIDLPGIAADHHPAVFAKTGQEHLHLRGGRVLRFIQDDECIGKSEAAHEGEGRNLDLSAGDARVGKEWISTCRSRWAA